MTVEIPSDVHIKTLHQKYAPSPDAFESVWAHCQIIARIADQIAESLDGLDTHLIHAGALLHDIGVYRLYKNGELQRASYITHGLEGYKILQQEGLDEVICRFALLHTGVGITKEDVKQQKLPLPPRDYVAETPEERVVMYADKFHSKGSGLMFNSAAWYEEFLKQKFGAHKANIFHELQKEFGVPDVEALAEEYNQPLR